MPNTKAINRAGLMINSSMPKVGKGPMIIGDLAYSRLMVRKSADQKRRTTFWITVEIPTVTKIWAKWDLPMVWRTKKR